MEILSNEVHDLHHVVSVGLLWKPGLLMSLDFILECEHAKVLTRHQSDNISGDSGLL